MDCSCFQRKLLFLHFCEKLRQKITARNKYVMEHTNNLQVIAKLPRMIYSGLEISKMYHDISDPRLTKSQACDLFIDRIVWGDDNNIFYIMRGFHLWKQMKEEFYQMNETRPLHSSII